MKFSLLLFFILIGVTTLGPWLVNHNPYQYHLESELNLPSWEYPMGNDENGRDILSRIIYGAPYSLGIAVSVVSVCLVLGILVGLISGYFGGWIDKIFLMVADLFQAFPGILLAIAIAAVMPASVINIIILLSMVGWVSYARVMRAQVLTIKELDYIQSAKAMGQTTINIFRKHILPNAFSPLLTQAAFGMAGVILIESTLSFLGLGVPLTTPTWGRMLDSGSSLLLVAPHVSLFPGFAIMFSILTFNLLGDALQEKLKIRK